MIHRLIEFSLRNRGIVIAIYLGLAAWVYWALNDDAGLSLEHRDFSQESGQHFAAQRTLLRSVSADRLTSVCK